jgi:26S proteasome regulatory subunit N3
MLNHFASTFYLKIQKFSIVVELLLGEIPDKATFRNPQFQKALQPYFQLTQAVRTGNLAKFNQVLEKFGDRFVKENTWTLIIR